MRQIILLNKRHLKFISQKYSLMTKYRRIMPNILMIMGSISQLIILMYFILFLNLTIMLMENCQKSLSIWGLILLNILIQSFQFLKKCIKWKLFQPKKLLNTRMSKAIGIIQMDQTLLWPFYCNLKIKGNITREKPIILQT